MNQLTDALLLREEASRSQIAILYGVIGLGIGAFVLGNK